MQPHRTLTLLIAAAPCEHRVKSASAEGYRDRAGGCEAV
jgi:hypothetical protein